MRLHIDEALDGDAPSTPIPIDEILTAIGNETEVQNDPAQLCCGVAGRINALLDAAHLIETSVWRDTATTLLEGVQQARQVRGWYRLKCHSPRLYNPGFFQGTAGIGYTFLRATAPTELPNILAFK
jgi:lantibiotic modifying enzyme